jgi:hypothetical protein
VAAEPTRLLRVPNLRSVHRIFTTSVADVYPHDVAKVERKGRAKAEARLAKGRPIERV